MTESKIHIDEAISRISTTLIQHGETIQTLKKTLEAFPLPDNTQFNTFRDETQQEFRNLESKLTATIAAKSVLWPEITNNTPLNWSQFVSRFLAQLHSLIRVAQQEQEWSECKQQDNEIINEFVVLRLPFTIQNTTRWSTVYVIPDIWRPCIIGNNFIRTHNLHIDGAHQRVYFPTIPTIRNLSDVYTPYQKRCSTQGIHTKHVEIPFSSSPPQVHDISYTNKSKTPESSDFSDSTLLEDQQQQLSDLIRLFPNVLSTNPGRTNKIQHHIDIQPGNKPRNSAPYRYSPARRQIIESNLNEMLQE
ncbi:unnamed protein product, partial [Rotaria magnacalcarata]